MFTPPGQVYNTYVSLESGQAQLEPFIDPDEMWKDYGSFKLLQHIWRLFNDPAMSTHPEIYGVSSHGGKGVAPANAEFIELYRSSLPKFYNKIQSCARALQPNITKPGSLLTLKSLGELTEEDHLNADYIHDSVTAQLKQRGLVDDSPKYPSVKVRAIEEAEVEEIVAQFMQELI